MLRSPKSMFPIPDEGIEIIRREGNFFVFPYNVKKAWDMDKSTQVEEPIPKLVPNNPVEQIVNGWCELHFEKGKSYPLRRIDYADENGELIVASKMACPKCIQRYQGLGVGRVDFL